jgi:3-deoxy-7-phosphoheptulonate synthase
MVSITEATSPDNVPAVAGAADIIQIGARNMYNYDLLRAAGRSGRPVLLKRSFSATLDEWVLAAEYLADAGAEQIVLCERGIRTFATETRNTLDLSVVALAHARTRLPVIVDVSHAAGRRDLLGPLTAAAFGVGAAAVMIEVHPDPDAALSDAQQQITVDEFAALRREVIAHLGMTAARLRAQTLPGAGVSLSPPTRESFDATQCSL